MPDTLRLSIFALFAFTAAIVMLFDSLRAVKPDAVPGGPPHFTPVLGIEAIGVGALTALIGAGGGFVIVPALVYLAGVPVQARRWEFAAHHHAQLPQRIRRDTSARCQSTGRSSECFTSVAAVGAILGTRLNPYVPQVRIKQGFALLILILLSIKVLSTLVK